MPIPKKLVIVGGCGHVGLPLGIALAQRGVNVSLLDINDDSIAKVNGGEMPFLEDGAPEALRSVVGKTLRATNDPNVLRGAEVVVTVIGTPLDRHLNPTVNDFYASVEGILPYMDDHALLVLRSTVYPGVTKLLFDRVKSIGRKIDIAFCPERIAEGRAMHELCSLPQIVSAFTAHAEDRAADLFGLLTGSIVRVAPMEAELAKLFSNSWRYLNFAISNQFYMIAQGCGLDFERIHHAVTHDYPRMKSFAGPGFAAGPCLLKDTLQLSAFANNSFFLGHAAMLVNEGLPAFLVQQLKQEMTLSDKSVAILGMAFKADVDDYRESLSYKLRHLLDLEARAVLCHDPLIKDDSFVTLEAALTADVIIIGAPHSAYKGIEIAADKKLLNLWNMEVRRVDAAKAAHAVAGGYR